MPRRANFKRGNETKSFPIDDPVLLGKLDDEGWVRETEVEGAERAAKQGKREALGVDTFLGKLKYGASELLHGASGGLTTILQARDPNVAEEINAAREGREGLTTGLQVLGGLATAGLTGGAGAAEAAAGKVGAGVLAKGAAGAAGGAAERAVVGGLAKSVAAKSVEKGLAREVAGHVATGAAAGALDNEGDYLAEVALGNKKLSAQGVIGSAATGAAVGGGVAGAIGLTARGAQRVRKMIPKAETAPRVARELSETAEREVNGVLSDGADLEKAGRATVAEHGASRIQIDPTVRRRAAAAADEVAPATAAIPSRAADDVATPAAKSSPRDLDEYVDRLASRSTNRPVPRAPESIPPVAEPDLESLMAASIEKLKGGTPIEELTRRARDAGTVGGAAGERAALAAANADVPSVRRVATATEEYAAARREVDELFAHPRQASAAEREYAAWRTGNADDAGALARAAENTTQELAGESHLTPNFSIGGSTGSVQGTAGRALVDGIVSGRINPRDISIDTLASPAEGALRRVRRPATADDILQAVERHQPDLGKKVTTALRGRLDELEDLPRVIPAVQRLEAAEAELVDALSAHHGQPLGVPPGSLRRAGDYRAAQSAHAEAKALGEARYGEALAEKAAAPIAESQSKAARVAGLAGQIADAGAALEVISQLGIPGLPAPRDMPLVGPVLSLLLKARAVSSVYRRLGGKIPKTANTVLAERAAAVRNRVTAAARSLLEGSEKALRAGARVAPKPAAILGRRLFADEGARPERAAADAPVETLWARRVDEIDRALLPGAIERVVRSRIPSDDPELAEHMTETLRRKFEYLRSVAPKPPPETTRGRSALGPWRPPASEITGFARVVEALDDPPLVLERALHGQATVDQIEAVKAVYPDLWADAARELIATVPDTDADYSRLVHVGQLFGVPLATTESVDFGAKMQAGYAPPPAQPTPTAPGSAPAPGITRPVDLGQRSMLQEES